MFHRPRIFDFRLRTVDRRFSTVDRRRLWTFDLGLLGLSVLFLFQTSLTLPFMEVFTQRDAALVLNEQTVQLDAGGKQLAAYLVTPKVPGRLPAVVLASGREGLSDALRTYAREMAGVGYVTLAVDYRGDGAADGSPLLREVLGRSNDLAQVVDWLAAQPAVDPDRIGALGWNDALDAVNRLAHTSKVTAVYPTQMDSQMRMTEGAWVDIYEFLGKHVEDALVPNTPAGADAPIVRIVDIMRAVNSEQGVRGRLARALTTPPADEAVWEQARSDAAMVAEAGNLLLAEKPPKGSPAGWRRRATDFRAAAQALLGAVERRDFAATQQSLRELPQTCAACHVDYR